MIYGLIASLICLVVASIGFKNFLKSTFEPIYVSRHSEIEDQIAQNHILKANYDAEIESLNQQINQLHASLKQENEKFLEQKHLLMQQHKKNLVQKHSRLRKKHEQNILHKHLECEMDILRNDPELQKYFTHLQILA